MENIPREKIRRCVLKVMEKTGRSKKEVFDAVLHKYPELENKLRTKVVDVHTKFLDEDIFEWLKNPQNVYVGRSNVYRKKVKNDDGGIAYLPVPPKSYNTKWHNPFKAKDLGLETTLELYEEYLVNSNLMDSLDEIQGKTLGCWCVGKHPVFSNDTDEICHGQILARYADRNLF